MIIFGKAETTEEAPPPSKKLNKSFNSYKAGPKGSK
jgi:hypothetical protein